MHSNDSKITFDVLDWVAKNIYPKDSAFAEQLTGELSLTETDYDDFVINSEDKSIPKRVGKYY